MSGTIDDPRMPNGDCDCASIPFRHLDANGHVPTCANWTYEMLWQERLARNLAVAAALYDAHDAGWRSGYDACPCDSPQDERWCEFLESQWTPGCGRPFYEDDEDVPR